MQKSNEMYKNCESWLILYVFVWGKRTLKLTSIEHNKKMSLPLKLLTCPG